jgi:hypothetical protein
MLKKAKELANTLTMLSAASVSTKFDDVKKYAPNFAAINTIPVTSANNMIRFCSRKAF